MKCPCSLSPTGIIAEAEKALIENRANAIVVFICHLYRRGSSIQGKNVWASDAAMTIMASLKTGFRASKAGNLSQNSTARRGRKISTSWTEISPVPILQEFRASLRVPEI
jgi:hypothetical protein